MGTIMQRGFKAWAEREAAAVRSRFGLAEQERLPARVLLKSLGAVITKPGLVPGMTNADIFQLTETDPGGWSALTIGYGDQPIVIVNDAHSRRRRESDLHHEASHLIRKHKPSELIRIGEFTLREYDGEAEEEARWLAGCLQLPRAALLSALKRGDSEDAIGSRYMASTEMIRYRRSATGIDHQLAASRR